MTDISSRLERLNRLDELARRARERAVPLPANLDGDFAEVVDAVVQVVRHYPGLSVLLAPGDGRPGSSVVRVTGGQGDADVTLVRSAQGGEQDFTAPGPEPGGPPSHQVPAARDGSPDDPQGRAAPGQPAESPWLATGHPADARWPDEPAERTVQPPAPPDEWTYRVRRRDFG